MAYEVVALGELLIDFTLNGQSAQGNPIYEANPGGAPCNVLAMLEKLGHTTAFIGKVGHDALGELLVKALTEAGINTQGKSGLSYSEDVPTTLAFVHTYPTGEREFSFYRKPGADMTLTIEDVDSSLIKGAAIFHYGTLSMTSPTCMEATKYAIDTARSEHILLSFDPNLREPLWDSLSDAKDKIGYGLSMCNILKISDNEIEFMTGTKDIDRGLKAIAASYPNIQLLCATMGSSGSKAYYKGTIVASPPLPEVHCIEKTGAGDTFCACVLHHILEHGIEGLSEDSLYSMLGYANAAASLITTRKGALRVMPSMKEIEDLLSGTI